MQKYEKKKKWNFHVSLAYQTKFIIVWLLNTLFRYVWKAFPDFSIYLWGDSWCIFVLG